MKALRLLKKIHRKRKGVRSIAYFLFALSLWLVVLKLIFYLDFSLNLTLKGRQFFYGVFLLFSLWLVLRLLFHLFSPFRPFEIALLVEKKYPHLKDCLISSVQFEVKASPYVSKELMEATKQEAEKKIAEIRPAQVVSLSPLWKNSSLFLFVLFLVSLPYWLGYESKRLYEIFWHRFVYLENVSWPRTVDLEIQIQGKGLRKIQARHYAIPIGSHLICEVKIRRGNPQKVWILIPKAPPIAMIPQGKSTFRYEFTPKESFSFQVQGGDFTSLPYMVDVRPYPTLVQIRYKRHYPSYLGIPSDKEWYQWSTLPVYWGTEILFQAVVSKPLQEAFLDINGTIYRGAGLVMEIQPNGTTLLEGKILCQEGKLIPIGMAPTSPPRPNPQGTFRITFHWKDTENMTAPTQESVVIQVRQDFPPTVEILSPQVQVELTPEGEAPLSLRAQDDFGLANLWIEGKVFRKKGKKYQLLRQFRTTLKNFSLKEKKREVSLLFPLSAKVWKKVQVGDRISLRVFAKDFKNIGTPNIGKSQQEVHLTIVEPHRILAKVGRILDEVEIRIREVLETQNTARRKTVSVMLSKSFSEEKLTPPLLGELSEAENLQESVTHSLREIEKEIEKGKTLLIQNKIQDREQLTLLQEVSQTLRHLGRELSPQVVSHFEKLIQEKQVKRLFTIRNLQENILEELEGILEKLNKWGGLEEILTDLRDLLQGQEAIHKKTKEIIQKK